MAKRKTKRRIWLYLVILLLPLGTFLLINKHEPCANSISCVSDLAGKPELSENIGEFMGEKVQVPQELSRGLSSKEVLGTTTSKGSKHIYIDLASQKIYAYENGRKIYEFLISSGKWGKTPTGEFTTWVKLKATRMSGGNSSLGTYYNLPNVPYTMFFYNKDIPKGRGFGIHGAYWHNNFGHPMSHGCINMRIEEAKLIYEWADPASSSYITYVDKNNPGTPITIYGTAPVE